jgi:hypothetical protein
MNTVHKRCLLLLTLAAALPALAGPFVAGPRDPHPDDPALRHRRAPFDCAARDTVVLSLATPTATVVDTTSGAGLLQTYACRSWLEDGPEHIFRLELASRLDVSAVLQLDPAVDLDLVLLSACDTDACLAQVNTAFTATLDAGVYILIVEGYHQAAGAYELQLDARAAGVPAQVCTPGFARTVEASDLQQSLPDSLAGWPDLIHGYDDCADVWYLGGEAWFALTLPPAAGGQPRRTSISATQFSASVDAALWVFDGCGETASCLAFADANTAGHDESLDLINDSAEPRLVYLAVDTLRPVSEGQDNFTLQLQAFVPVERRSLGDVKSLFR